jgi:hypothetical protein
VTIVGQRAAARESRQHDIHQRGLSEHMHFLLTPRPLTSQAMSSDLDERGRQEVPRIRADVFSP